MIDKQKLVDYVIAELDKCDPSPFKKSVEWLEGYNDAKDLTLKIIESYEGE